MTLSMIGKSGLPLNHRHLVSERIGYSLFENPFRLIIKDKHFAGADETNGDREG